MNDEYLSVAIVRKAHGLKGQVWAEVMSGNFDALAALDTLYMKADAVGAHVAKWKDMHVIRVGGEGSKRALLLFAEVNDRTHAEALCGVTLYAKRSDLPALDADEVYLRDLVGLSVFLPGSEATIGTVASIQMMGTQETLSITAVDGYEILIPLVPAFIQSVDFQTKRIEIDPPEGLLDLNMPKALV